MGGTPKWRTLTIDCYDRLRDPDEHVDAFVTPMSLFTNSGTIILNPRPESRSNTYLNPFSDNLCKKPLATLEELRARVVSFIQMEKMIEGSHNRGKSRKDKPPQSKFSHYTLLTESCRDSLRIKNLHGSKKGSVIKVDSVVGLEKQYNRNHDETSPPETQIQGVINMIAGGFTSGGSSKSASKCYVRSLKFVN
ncbi:hypothetical protein HKD37_14G040341 [Glycine soja]